MKTEVKVFIALLVMLLSTGPLMYFFGGTTTQQIDYDENSSTTSLISTVSANATATVLSLRPYISFVGISATNNATFLGALMDYINYTDNYTTKVTLNPSGDGYRYNMIVYLKNESDTVPVGFKLNLLSAPYFTSSYVTTLGTVLLDSTFTSGNRTFTANNMTATTVFLYSDKPSSHISVVCDLTVTTKTGNVTDTDTCVSTTEGYKQGLSATDYFLNSVTVDRTMNLTVYYIDSTGVFGNYSNMTLNETKIASDLNITSDLVYADNPVNGTGEGNILIRISGDAQAKAEEAIALLKSMNVTVTETYKVGGAIPPGSIVIGNETKPVSISSYVPIKIALNETTGVKTVDLTFTLVFGEIADVTQNLE